MIVPFAPGGPTDVFTRIVALKMSEQTGKQFYVENIGGAGGNTGTGRAAQAAPDGYTVLVDRRRPRQQPVPLQPRPLRSVQGLRRGDARREPAGGARGPPVGAGAERQGADRAGQSQSRQIQLRVARRRHAAATRRRAVPALACARSHSRAVQRRRPRGRLDGRGPHADVVRCAHARGAADQGRQAARARGDVKDARQGVARRADHGGGRLSGGRGHKLGRASWCRPERRRRSSRSFSG